MAGTLRLILALHNHQPVGNFDGVFEQTFQESYQPFLNVFADYPEICFALHTSGSLLEWLESHHPEYIDQLRSFVECGQVEIIGGAFYEPILGNIPRRDRIGQIQSYTDHLQRLFGTKIDGMWMPERVWEQSFAGDLTAAGIRYTILDDHHFRSGGMKQDQLYGYHVTEDEGRLLAVLPGSERMRYLVPFRNPEETIHYLRGIADHHEDPVVVFGDDGEKFGTWPETHQHVYTDRWLRRFLDELRANDSWLQLTTPRDVLQTKKPEGIFYIPDASYREMTEWVLEPDTQQDLSRLTHIEGDDNWRRMLDFVRGGFWRNFRVRYPESNEMYCRMLEISTRLANAEQDEEFSSETVTTIRQHLYRAQCNCSYWHGAFGGLYLPHLRNAVYSNLIAADNLLEQTTRRSDNWIDVSTGDYNLDAQDEVRISNHRLAAYFCPERGGQMYELDVRGCRTNLLATLDRRPEPYHRKVLEYADQLRDGGSYHDSDVASIHDIVRFKQPNLDEKIAYDKWPRKSLIDHFLQPHIESDVFRRGDGVISNLSSVPYATSVHRNDDEVTLTMSGTEQLGSQRVQVRKIVCMSSRSPGEILVCYELSDLPQGVPLHYGTEFNFATMPGGASDRYFYGNFGEQLGTLDAGLDLHEVDRIGLVDEWQGLDVSLESTKHAGLWAFPIETISQSESGFELVQQSVAVVPHWNFVAPESGSWTVDLRLSVNTSVAQARELATLGEQRQRATTADHD